MHICLAKYVATIPVVGPIVSGLVGLACAYGGKDTIKAILTELSNATPFDSASCYQTGLLDVQRFKRVDNRDCN